MDFCQRVGALKNKARYWGEKATKSHKMGTTYNTFRNTGCHYEFNNNGENCVYLHCCSKCKSKGLIKKHKARQCDNKMQKSVGSTKQSAVTGGASTPVTSG